MTSSENQPAPTSTSTEPALTEGQRLAGCYVLLRPVDTGGGAVVWLAHDEVLGKDISLHFLPAPIRADARAMEEIRKEVKRNRQLIHPNILRVHDFVEEPDFTAVAMDSFEAESLAASLKRRGSFEPGMIQPWIGQLCQTLEDAHKINLVHRDLSPANIFLGAGGKVLLSGFGISRCVQDALGRVVRGSNPRLAYLSPQQADGQAPTRSDDVYSLGMLLFELLTGELPFNGGDVLSQIRRVAAPRVSARLAAGRRPSNVPPSWDETIAAALRKDASQRPATATDVASRLEAIPEIAIPAADSAAPASKTAEPPKRTEASKFGSRMSPATPPLAAAKFPEPVSSAVESQPIEAAKPAAEAAALEATAADAPKAIGSAGSESPARKAVDILRERAAELKRNQASGGRGGFQTPVADSKPTGSESRREAKITPPPVPPVVKSPKTDNVTDIYPSLQQKRSRFPALGLAAGLALAAVGVAGYFLNDPSKEADTSEEDPAIAMTEQSFGSEIRSVNNKTEYPPSAPEPDATKPASDPLPTPSVAIVTAPPVEAIAPKPEPTAPSKPEILLAAKKPATPPPAPPVPAATPSTPTTAVATEGTVAEKFAAVDKLKQAVQAAEQAQQDLMKQQQQAESAATEIQKVMDQKSKDLAPLRKATEELAKARKAKADAQSAAELEAQKAQQMAAEKVRLADEAKKALADLEAQTKEKLNAQEKADAELLALQKTFDEKQRAAAAAAKAVAAYDATRQQQLAAMKQAEQDAEQTRMVVAKAMAAESTRKAREEAETLRAQKAKEREKIESEIAAMKKLFDEKLKVLEEAQKAISDAEAKSKDSAAMQKQAEEEALKALSTPTAPAGGKPAAPHKAPAPEKPTAAEKLIPTDAPPAPSPTAAPAVPTAPAPTLAMKTEPTKPDHKPDAKPVQGAGLLENSLGMKFAPVGDVLVSIWQTRVSDFEVFARALPLRSTAWKGPGFKQAPDHPVVNVTWQEALAFCKWLTEKERKDGSLPASTLYRLPTDAEWSTAVGLPEESGKNPEARDMGIPDVYPWGNQWPPPSGAGNYTGEETGSDVAIKGYDDGFAWTSPVGSFPANKYGLYDMGGNVWQWVMDAWNTDSKHKVLRGASWYNGALKLSLLSSCRVHAASDSSTDNYGFRVVRASETAKSARR